MVVYQHDATRIAAALWFRAYEYLCPDFVSVVIFKRYLPDLQIHRLKLRFFVGGAKGIYRPDDRAQEPERKI
jgi:hypothetical protein